MQGAGHGQAERNLSMKERDQAFQYLKALAILMVIDDHTGQHFGCLTGIFPYDSFFMPLFVLISGYFFKDRGILPNIRQKIRHLLVPFIAWSVAGDLIAFILNRAGIVNWYRSPLRIRNIVRLLTDGPLSSINGPAWFALMLFWISVVYCIAYRLLRLDKKIPGYAFLTVSVAFGFISLKLCMSGYNRNTYLLPVLRIVWYLQFYHIGVMFRKYWERGVRQARLLLICSLCVIVNAVLIRAAGDIRFISTSGMDRFHSWWIPLITSITGGLFWYKIMRFLAPRTGRIRIVDFIADNTFTIMCAHLMFAKIPEFFAYFQCLAGDPNYADFPVSDFQKSAWVSYNANTDLAGFFCALLGSLLAACVIQKARRSIAARKNGRSRHNGDDAVGGTGSSALPS